MKFQRITIVLLLFMLLASGLACEALGGEADSIPSAPILSSPSSEAVVHGTSVTFQWNASAGATKYGLRVSEYPDLAEKTSFFSEEIGDFTVFTLPGFPDDATVYYWGVWAGNAAGWSPYAEVVAKSRSFTNGDVPLGYAYVTPLYNLQSEQVYFLLTAWAREPSYLDISNPDGSLLDRVFVPPMVEQKENEWNIDLPPAPSGGTYGFNMHSDVTGELLWQGEQTFTGPKINILELSLNPHWVQGVGWDLQYLTMKLQNTGDMPITLYGLKLRLEGDSFSTQEITLNRSDNTEAKYGWTTPGTVIANPDFEGYGIPNMPRFMTRTDPGPATITVESWGLEPYSKTSSHTTIIPWASEEQFLFGQYFDPGEYLLYLTLSDQLIVLPVPELAFDSP